jgi:hypothetical protein
MKKIYMAPQMECGLMGDLLPLCVSGVTGDGVIEDVDFGGTDDDGILEPD